MNVNKQMRLKGASGQSLVEAALMLPFVLLLIFNVVNFGYFFLVALNLAAASRSAVEYSVQGFATPAAYVLPPSGSTSNPSAVSNLALQDLGVLNPARVSVKVCNPANPNAGNLNCTTPASDPEQQFQTTSVDVVYTFTPLIAGTVFNLPLRASAMCNPSGTCTFVRHAQMRAMN